MPALYKGIKAPLTGLAAINAIVFGVHGSVMRRCPNESRNQFYLWNGLAGLMSGFAQSLVSCPMEMVKTRAQLSSLSPRECIRRICAQEGGRRALFKGFGVTLWRDCPAFAIYFASYEWMLDYYRRRSSLNRITTLDLLMAGGTAGALSWFVIYPVDVIKSRMQASTDPLSTRQCVRIAWQDGGIKVFMRGCSPTLLRAFPTNAATFAMVTWTLYTYEMHINGGGTATTTSKTSGAVGVAAAAAVDSLGGSFPGGEQQEV